MLKYLTRLLIELFSASNDVLDEDDDDDDDDLAPIDSVDVPSKSGIVYIRDFMERLPAMKTYDETRGQCYKTFLSVIYESS